MNHLKIHFILIPFLVSCSVPKSQKQLIMPSPEELHEQAVMESLVPVHPGNPGSISFWNSYATRFIYAPAFDFPALEGADSYLFTLQSDKDTNKVSFISDHPWSDLSPAWNQLPTGMVSLSVEGRNSDQTIGLSGERKFYKAAAYNGPYHQKTIGYSASAEKALRYLFNAPYMKYWLDHGTPDPGYGLYCYPSKMISAVISGMLEFSGITADTAEQKEAMQIARIAADYLISLSQPEDTPLEFFPPTYTGPIYADMQDEWRGEDLSDRMMLIYPASAGQAYLELYNATLDKKYLEAALKVADTYKKIQLENGTWYLLEYVKDGSPVAGNFVVPTGVYGLLNRLEKEFGITDYRETGLRAISWMEMNLVKDFNWEGQFEDQKPSDRYKNLSKGQACGYALYLMNSEAPSDSVITLAEEIIRFAEDQFVIWQDPVPGDYWGIKSDVWITPCVLEQYNFYTPVNASSSNMIEVFINAHKHTGNILYLARAIDLANTIVATQNKQSGHYPTYLVSDLLDQEGWINCMAYTASVIKRLDDYLNERSPGKEISLTKPPE